MTNEDHVMSREEVHVCVMWLYIVYNGDMPQYVTVSA